MVEHFGTAVEHYEVVVNEGFKVVLMECSTLNKIWEWGMEPRAVLPRPLRPGVDRRVHWDAHRYRSGQVLGGGSTAQHKKNVLVEGLTDYLYLHGLNLCCHARGRKGLPEDIYITPCGGTKMVGHIASLFLGQQVRPVVLLDGDDAGRARRDALMKELYADYERAVLMLGDVLEKEKCETEDIIGEATILPVLKEVLWKQSEN